MELREFELVQRIIKLLDIKEVDDCAILPFGNEYIVITTDMLHKSTDFPDSMTPWQIGWMAVAVNLSDIAAMGAKPCGVLMAIGFPRNISLQFFEEIINGMNACAKRYNTKVIGGDIDTHQELTLVGNAIGIVQKDLIIKRKGAKVGDLVCVTGNIGDAAAGSVALEVLKNDYNIPDNIRNTFTTALFEPKPRVKEGMALAKSKVVTSMMDISDGLAISLHELARINKIGFKIYWNRVPILKEMKDIFNLQKLLELVLYTGGDFELLFTVNPYKLEHAKRACNFTVIGEVIENGVFIEINGVKEKLDDRGYEHVRQKVQKL
ncbi:MAG TPA: thiamine-phosphate kinase [Methanosarcinales archaeon]|nr:thiamine-phosphate kinase [Methanosarcinales archaeon]